MVFSSFNYASAVLLTLLYFPFKLQDDRRLVNFFAMWGSAGEVGNNLVAVSKFCPGDQINPMMENSYLLVLVDGVGLSEVL